MVVEIKQDELKREITKDILSTLPQWFGTSEAVQIYVRQSSNSPFFAYVVDDKYVGLLFLKVHNDYSAEICAMGVLEDYRRQGIGRALMNKCLEYCEQNNIEYLQVKTLDSSFPDYYFKITRDFYTAMGFKPLECIPSLWDEESPCLIMIMHVKCHEK
ncbi:MAG TPA: GNAT family N-acetyltransferase [Clostridia bacterium]